MKASPIFTVALLFGLISCQETTTNKKKSDSPELLPKTLSTKAMTNESSKERAAKLARVGEILINNPVGITHAHDLFTEALTLDPSNNKALFYSSFTEIVMSLKGSANKAKNLFDDPNDYKLLLEHFRKEVKYPEFVDFIKGDNSAKKFKDLQDVKRFVQTDVVNAFEKANAKLNSINGDVKVILTQLKTDNSISAYNCTEETDEEYGDTYTNCEYKESMDSLSVLPAETVTVDSKDIKMLAAGMKAYSTYLKLYTAYSIKGQKHLTNEIKVKEMELGRNLTDKETHIIAKKYNSYLTLEKDNKLNEIVADLDSIIEIGMDLESLNNKFCDSELRENNLIKTICFDQNARADMQRALDLLAGPQEIVLGVDQQGAAVNIILDLPAFLNNPVDDLKSLMPTTYHQDGSSNHTVEPELNGLFPNKDLLEKLKTISHESEY